MLLVLIPSLVFSAPFVPTRLQLTLPSVLQYNFDGSTLEIPVNVNGTPARIWFFVFTKDKGDEIGVVQNGYLGWHYVNKIDTCLYTSEPLDFQVGNNTITWTGVDDDGGTVPAGEYTYYLCVCLRLYQSTGNIISLSSTSIVLLRGFGDSKRIGREWNAFG